MRMSRTAMVDKVLWLRALAARAWLTVRGGCPACARGSVKVALSVLWLGSAFSVLPGCASAWGRSCLPEEPRVASRLNGVPVTTWDDRARLIELEPRRYCQVLFEGAFSRHHAVWLTNQPSGEAKVAVAVWTDSVPERFEALLDERTARAVESACYAFHTSKAPRCARSVADGVRYHAAHYVDSSGYAMRSFKSPRPGTQEIYFVRLAEALRDYAVAPKGLASVYWSRIMEAVGELECALDPELYSWCKRR